MIIQECDAPTSFKLELGSDTGHSWFVTAELSHSDGVTTAEFHQILHPEDPVADMGAGWDFYLDRLVAANTGKTAPPWADYHPGLVSDYEQIDDSVTCS